MAPKYNQAELAIVAFVEALGKLASQEALRTMVGDAGARDALVAACGGRVIDLTERQACDCELLMCGAFSPLTGFMDEATYDHVVGKMRLPEQQLMGMPVTMDVPGDAAYCEGRPAQLQV